MEKIKLIVLFGPAGSGKDTILKKALKKIPQLHKPILYTSRPKREKELNGVHYNFISQEEFTNKLIVEQNLIEASVFNGWGYGSTLDCYDSNKINILALGIEHLKDIMNLHSDIFDVFPIYIKVSDKERLLRQLNREKNPNVNEIIRRFQSDKEDYSKLDFFYYVSENENKWDLRKSIKFLKCKVKDIQLT